jgi:large subunit ribosomal protein L17
VIDRLITTAKKKDAMNAVRALNAFVTDKNASRKVMEVLIARYKTRPSGFTTMKAVGSRKGDGAEMVDLALVDAVLARRKEAAEAPVEKKAKPAKKTAAKKTKSSAPSETPSTPSK